MFSGDTLYELRCSLQLAELERIGVTIVIDHDTVHGKILVGEKTSEFGK